MELIFREVQCGDIEDLFSVRARTRENPASIAQLAKVGITPASSAEALASGRVKGWLCTAGGSVVGFCTGHSETGEVLVLAVLPEYETRGIGRRLLTLVVEWLRSSDDRNIWLAASPNPAVRAHGFYRSLGWVPSGETLSNGDEILVLARHGKPASTMQSPPEILTGRLVLLRRARPADAKCLYRAAIHPEVMRYMDWAMPTNPEDTEAHLRRTSADWDAGAEYQWVILDRGSGGCIGTIACRARGRHVDFGYFLDRKHWGRGLGADAASTLLGWLDAQPEITRIWATVDIENARSRRLLERMGLRLEAVLKMATIRPNIGGPARDTAVYARMR